MHTAWVVSSRYGCHVQPQQLMVAQFKIEARKLKGAAIFFRLSTQCRNFVLT